MADAKLEKALYGPSLTEVALGAVLGLGCGVLAACVFLVFKPVQQVREMPEEPERGTVYFLPGSELSGKARSWSAKEKQFLTGSSVVLVEDELSAWAAATLKKGTKAGTKPGDAPQFDGIFNPDKLNFKITDNRLQIGFKCTLNWYGLTKEVMIVTSGTFSRSGDKFKYAPATVYLGSCPLHLLPTVPGLLISHLIGKPEVPDELSSAWAKLSEVSIEGNTLKLTL